MYHLDELLKAKLRTPDALLEVNNTPLVAVFSNEFASCLLQHGRHKTRIMLQNCDLQSVQLHDLADALHHLHIQSFHISRNRLEYNCSGAIRKILDSWGSLTELDMRSVGVVDHLALAELVIQHPSIAIFNAVPIARLRASDPSFKVLNLQSMEINEHGGLVLAHYLRKNSSVTSVNISHNSLTSAALCSLAEVLEHNRVMTSLNISNNSFGLFEMAQLADVLSRNTSLKHLNVSCTMMGPKGARLVAAAVAQNKTLQILDVEGNNIGNSGLASFASALLENNTLTSINLSSNNIGGGASSEMDDGNEEMRQLTNMLKDNHTLERLFLRSNTITVAMTIQLAEGLAYNTGLKILSLDWNPFGDLGLKPLANALRRQSTLQELSVVSCKLTHDSAVDLSFALRFNSGIKACDISDNCIGLLGMISLANVVRNKKHFICLRMNNCRAWNNGQDSGMETLLSCLFQRPASHGEVSLKDNGIGTEFGKVVSSHLTQTSLSIHSLSTLDLSGNVLGVESSEAVALLVRHSSALSTLKLRNTQLSNNGITTIADAIEDNTSLTHLDLECSYDDSLAPLTTAILACSVNEHPKLQYLSLSGNHIGEAGSVIVAAMLRENRILSHIRLDSNNFNTVAAHQLSEAIPINSTLRSCTLDSNPLCTTELKHFIFRSISTNLGLVHVSARPSSSDSVCYIDPNVDATILQVSHARAVDLRVSIALLGRMLNGSSQRSDIPVLPAGPVDHIFEFLYSSSPIRPTEASLASTRRLLVVPCA